MYRILADLTFVAHLLFIVFVVGGGFLARRRRWLKIVHLSAVAWGITVELAPGALCPLTTLENVFAARAGRETYDEGFIARYLVPIIYPEGLTREIQVVMVAIVLVVNAVAYFPRKKKTQ